MMYRNLAEAGLRGPVSVLVEERADKHGLNAEVSEFDGSGNLIKYKQRHSSGREYVHDFAWAASRIELCRHEDGGRTEVVDARGAPGWRPPVPGLAFTAMDEGTIETTFSSEGVPVRTVTRRNGEELNVVGYRTDDRGRIVEVIESNGTAPPEWARALGSRGGSSSFVLEPGSIPESIGVQGLETMLTPGAERSRHQYRYDDAGRLLEHIKYFAGRPRSRTTYEYNEHGDLTSSQSDDTGPVPIRIEYEYDARGNWISKVVHHGDGSDHYRRVITYIE
jgi:hypothetical protein